MKRSLILLVVLALVVMMFAVVPMAGCKAGTKAKAAEELYDRNL